MGLNYEIESIPCGVFKSRLELQWWIRLRQLTARLQYVGHIDYWRDFLVHESSFEIKPCGIAESDDIVLDAVLQRVPHSSSQLSVLIGSPIAYSFYKCIRNNGCEWSITSGHTLREV